MREQTGSQPADQSQSLGSGQIDPELADRNITLRSNSLADPPSHSLKNILCTLALLLLISIDLDSSGRSTDEDSENRIKVSVNTCQLLAVLSSR